MKVLVIQTKLHSGTISVHFGLCEKESLLLKGTIDHIGEPSPQISFEGDDVRRNIDAPNCSQAVMRAIDATLSRAELQQKDIAAIGYHVAHGGEKFKEHCLIDERVIDDIRRCIPLAPLHNPYNLITIETGKELYPSMLHVAIFDTCFHLTMPDYAYIYGIPYDYYIKYGIRRYGFGGLSHQFMAEQAALRLGRPAAELKLITCHLSDGASIAAIRGGKCLDTSMGFTPLEGLLMATRCGDLDPSIVTFLLERNGSKGAEIEAIMNKQGGLLGVSAISGDIEELVAAVDDGSYRARLAVDIYCYRLKKYIASYLGVLEGADAIVFSGAAGFRCAPVRKKALEGFSWAGLALDSARNDSVTGDSLISSDLSTVTAFAFKPQETMMVAKETFKVLESSH